MPKNIIIVDDSNFLIKQLRNFMEKEFDVKVVASGNDGNEAIKLYKKYKPDLITLDITMPNKSGIDATIEILGEFPTANICIISAVKGDAMIECLNIGARGYIEKPLNFNNIEFVKDFKETINEIFKLKP